MACMEFGFGDCIMRIVANWIFGAPTNQTRQRQSFVHAAIYEKRLFRSIRGHS